MSDSHKQSSGQPAPDVLLQTRTTGSESHPGEGACRRCGGPIRGRRRNGYRSDRCRMQDYREAERETLIQMFDDVQTRIADLRIAVTGNDVNHEEETER